MTPDQLKRKLTTILSADVKGYSRLMGEDEEWTLRMLNNHKEMMGSLIQQHRGRVVGTAGDNVMAEFASVVDAVQCAVEIQQMLRAKNAMLPEGRRMEFRIGINLGDVIEEGDSIYGDGVNIAARLESMAEAGGICISGSAFEQIENKLPLKYEYLGEHQVKNIAKPVRIYRARIEPETTTSLILEEKKPERKKLSRAVLAGIVLVLIATAAGLYLFAFHPFAPTMEVASKDKMAYPLPDVPSIAVLPFVNMSGDPKQEFFSDGITEDIITALSKIPNLFVIARNSTFTYKGKPVKVKQVSEELGVRYVLEGSVQKSGDLVRITAQLIDALSGHHLWSEHYDRDLKDIFALQDEVTLHILTALDVKLLEGEKANIKAKYAIRGKQSLEFYLKLQEGVYLLKKGGFENNYKSSQIGEEIIKKWPEYPSGYILLGWTYYLDLLIYATKSPQESLGKAIEMAQKGLAIDDSHSSSHGLLGLLYCYLKKYDQAIAEGKRGVALLPNGAEAYEQYGHILLFAGHPEEAIPTLQKAIRLNPISEVNQLNLLGLAYLSTNRFEEAVSVLKQALRKDPDNPMIHIHLAAGYAFLGREKEARAEAAEVLRILPNFSLNKFAKRLFSHFKDESAGKTYINALGKAGLK